MFFVKAQDKNEFHVSHKLCFFLQASKAGLCIYRPGMKMEEEESQGWLSWMWNWGGEAEKPKDVKTGGMT